MSTYHEIDMAYPLTTEFTERDKEIEAVAKKYNGVWMSSGAGQGLRDIQIEVRTEQEANDLIIELEKKYSDFDYISYCTLDEDN